MQFRILGPLEVLDDTGRPLVLGGAKQRALLALLLLQAEEVVSADRLIDELWGEEPPDTARSVLQVYVANLRKVLEPTRPRRMASSLLRTQPPGYQLDLGGHALDLDRFEQLASEGRAALAAGQASEAANLLRGGLGLWRGPALADVVLEISGQGEVARLEERRLAALEDRIEADLMLGHHGELVGELQALVAAHPLRERLRGQLMLALYRSGRQAEALAAYRQARETLAEELGIDPSAALQELERAILAQDRELAPPALMFHATTAPIVRNGAPSGQAGALSPPATQPSVVACYRCGQENLERVERCTACGASLTPAQPGGREERKVITVLACELVGPGAPADPADPEDLRTGLRPYRARICAELERFGGSVERVVGADFMAVFGAPIAHEDDPERAVRAALAIRDGVAELSQAPSAATLEIQLGIATGEALLVVDATSDAGEAGIIGVPITSAVRLQQAAPPGTVLVDEATHRATTHSVSYERGKPLRVSGATTPLPSWRATVASSAVGAEVARQPPTPFIGRQDELDLLKGTYARAARESTVHLVTITGEPGVGKSRLVQEFAAFLDAQEDPLAWRQGRCLPYGEGITFWALGEVVKAEAGVLESDDPKAAAKLAAAVVAVIEESAECDWFTSRLAPLVGIDGQSGGAVERSEAFTAWRRFLEAIAARRPLVVVVEDLHWADEALLAFLEHLLAWASPVPLLLVCTARPELYDQAPGWGGGTRNATTIALSPLTDEEIARLLSMLLAQSVLPAELQRLLLVRAEGNPLYAEEFVRLLTDRKLLERRGRTPRLAEGAELPVPETLYALIAARLDALSPEHKALLQDAAVVGQVFWSGALAAMSQGDEQPVHQALRALARKELVRPIRRSSVAGQAEYAFWHVLVRDVAYGQLPRTVRADRHRRAAEWLEALSPDRVDDRAELLAHHWQAALRFARAAGQETADFAERARVALREAGDRALTLHAFAAAARWYTAALELWPAGDSERPRLLLGLGQARFHAEEAGGELLAEARDGLLASGDREGAAEAEALLGQLARWQAQGERAMGHARQAVALLQDAGPSPAKAFVLVNLASALMQSSQAQEAIRIGQQALTIAETLGLDEVRARALNTIGSARTGSGDFGGVADLEQAIAVAAQANSPLQTAAAYHNLAMTVIYLGDLTRGFELMATAHEVAERFGLAFIIRGAPADRALQDYWQGRWDAALDRADQFLAEAEAGSPSYMEPFCRRVRGLIRLARGDLPGALADATTAVEGAIRLKDPESLLPALAFHARALQTNGQVQEATARVKELLGVIAEYGPLPTYPDWSGELAVVLHVLGRAGELLELTAAVTAPTPWLQAATAMAASEFEQAADTYAKIGSLPDEAFARLRAAQCLVASGRQAEASVQLRRALPFYRKVRANAYVRAAEALLAASA